MTIAAGYLVCNEPKIPNGLSGVFAKLAQFWSVEMKKVLSNSSFLSAQPKYFNVQDKWSSPLIVTPFYGTSTNFVREPIFVSTASRTTVFTL